MPLLVRGGLVYVDGRLRQLDVLAHNESTVALLEPDSAIGTQDAEIVDASGCWVVPALIDTHVHFRDPGYDAKEDFESGSRAAAAGGIGMFVDMPNTLPPPNTVERLREHRALAQAKAMVDFNHWALPTVLAEIPGLASEGIVGFKFFMKQAHYPYDSGVSITDHFAILETLRAIACTGLPCLVHTHDQAIWTGKAQRFNERHENDRDAFRTVSYGERGILQTTGAALAALLGDAVGCRIRILHVQGDGQLRLVRALRAEGYELITEMNPQAVFTVEALASREPGDVDANWAALESGTIDVIGSDHAPHTREEEMAASTETFESVIASYPWAQYWGGLFLRGVLDGKLSIGRFVELSSTRVAQHLGVYPRKGEIAVGADADYAIFDPRREDVVGQTRPVQTRGSIAQLAGKVGVLPVATVVRGRVVYRENEFHVSAGYGKFIPPGAGIEKPEGKVEGA